MSDAAELVSIIVPVYNTEQYLKRCVDSILAQSYKNIEIILVDDGSTDGSGEICDFYAEQDERIQVVHKTNEGVAQARNTALKLSKGNYIGFVDSDDYIQKNMFGKLLTKMISAKADIAICGYTEFGNNSASHTYCEAVYPENKAMQLLLKNRIESFTWNKLYRAEILKKLEFPPGYRYEDVLIMHKVFQNAKRIITIPDCLYFYNIREDSITGSTRFNKSREFIDSLDKRTNYLKGSAYYFEAVYGEYISLRRLVYEIIVHGEEQGNFYDNLIQKSKKLYNDYSSNFSIVEQMIGKIFLLSPSLYVKIRFFCKKILHI